MSTTPTKLLVIWFAAALSLVAFVAGFNVVVDPFGYFNRNTVGYFFSSERQFKYSIVKSYDYNAILLGDSRIAFTDTSQINRPEYTFVNGGIGGASLEELVALLAASRLDRLKLAVFGLQFGDLAHCIVDDESPSRLVTTSAPVEYGSWDALRFAASWTQLMYATDALWIRAQGGTPKYHEDGTRSVVSKHFEESLLDGKTARYWHKIEKDIPQEGDGANYHLGERCRQLFSEARTLANRHGFTLMIVFLPRNSDLLKELHWETARARDQIRQFLSEVEEVVPHVVDLSNSAFSESRNFWLNDSMHFKPVIGAKVVTEAINRMGAQAKR
jgi:hypothetical protein